MAVFDEDELFKKLQGGVMPTSSKATMLLAMVSDIPESHFNLEKIFTKLCLPFKTQENVR